MATDENRIIPPERFGVRVMSMGFFQKKEDEAIIWRGPMIHNAINQLLQSTEWGDLDYLVIDLPPGTSDSPLTVMQTIPMDGFVVVTTPQDLAKIDAKRSINMIRTLQVDVLGIVENMSGEVFGSGAGEELAREMDLGFLGRLEMRDRLPRHVQARRPQQRRRALRVPPRRGRDRRRPGQADRRGDLGCRYRYVEGGTRVCELRRPRAVPLTSPPSTVDAHATRSPRVGPMLHRRVSRGPRVASDSSTSYATRLSPVLRPGALRPAIRPSPRWRRCWALESIPVRCATLPTQPAPRSRCHPRGSPCRGTSAFP